MDWDNLSEEEQERLRLLLSLNRRTINRLQKVAEEDERMEWLWAMARRIASTIAIIIGSIILMLDSIKQFVRSLLQ